MKYKPVHGSRGSFLATLQDYGMFDAHILRSAEQLCTPGQTNSNSLALDSLPQNKYRNLIWQVMQRADIVCDQSVKTDMH